jgi:sugar/nucleoside kinase (ribokinase family)
VSDTFDLLVLGDANPDLVLRGGDIVPAFGQAERLVEEATLTLGGSGAITACAAVRLGLRVAICGVVGDDLFGRFIRERLDHAGVDTQGLAVDASRPTGISVVLSGGEDRAILTSLGTIGDLRAELVDPELLEGARHVHVSSYFLQPGLARDLPEILGRVRAAGGSTSVDPNWDPSGGWDGGLLDLLRSIDVLLPNAIEATRLARTSDLDAAVLSLGRNGDVVVTKDGSNGAVAAVAGELVRVEAPDVRPIDTTGAGDAFDAGLIAGLLAGRELEAAMRMANVVGALSTQAVGGAEAQPTMDEVVAILGEESAA